MKKKDAQEASLQLRTDFSTRMHLLPTRMHALDSKLQKPSSGKFQELGMSACLVLQSLNSFTAVTAIRQHF